MTLHTGQLGTCMDAGSLTILATCLIVVTFVCSRKVPFGNWLVWLQNTHEQHQTELADAYQRAQTMRAHREDAAAATKEQVEEDKVTKQAECRLHSKVKYVWRISVITETLHQLWRSLPPCLGKQQGSSVNLHKGIRHRQHNVDDNSQQKVHSAML